MKLPHFFVFIFFMIFLGAAPLALSAQELHKAKVIFEDNFESYPQGAFSRNKRKDGRIGAPQGIGLGFWRIGQVGGEGIFGREDIVRLDNRQVLKVDRTSNENEPQFKRNYIEAVFERLTGGIINIKVDFWVPKIGDTFNVAIRQGETPLVILDLNGERSNCARGELRYVTKFPRPLVAKCTGQQISLNTWHTIELNYTFVNGKSDFYSVILDGKLIIQGHGTVNDFAAAYIDNIIFEDWTKGDDNNYFLLDNLIISQSQPNIISMGQSLEEYAKTLPEAERQKLLAYIAESNRQVKEAGELNDKLGQEIVESQKELVELKKELNEVTAFGQRWRNLSRNMEDKMFHSLMQSDQDFLALKEAQDYKALQDQDYVRARLLMQQQKNEEAIPIFEQLSVKYPETLLVKIGLSRALFRFGRAEEARKLFRSYLLQYVNYISGN